MTLYEQALAYKSSGYRGVPVAQPGGKMGFVFSAAEMKRLGELRDSMQKTSTSVQGAGRLLAAGLGAVALGLGVSAIARARRQGHLP